MKIAWCQRSDPSSNNAPIQSTHPELGKSGIGRIGPFESGYAGVVGGSAGIGAVVWTAVWTPLTTDAAPRVTAPSSLYDAPGDDITGIQINYNSFPPVKGLMTLHATIDGVKAENYLTLSRSADASTYVYGAVSWNTWDDVVPPEPVKPSFWAGFVNATETI